MVTVRDRNGDLAYREPVVFLPQDASFLSFGVIKAADARPAQIGFEGLFYPTFLMLDGDPITVMGDDKNPTLSMLVYTGDLGLDSGAAQSIYVLDKFDLEQVRGRTGSRSRWTSSPGRRCSFPTGWARSRSRASSRSNRIQISQTPEYTPTEPVNPARTKPVLRRRVGQATLTRCARRG